MRANPLPILKSFFAAVCIFLMHQYCFAQNDKSINPASDFIKHHLFEMITEKEGLPEQGVADICFDKNNFMWIGTGSGLYRYDGISFRHFDSLTYRNKKTFINDVGNFYLDADSFLWFSCNAGIVKYSLGNAADEIYPVNEADSNGIPHAVNQMQMDDKKRMWMSFRGPQCSFGYIDCVKKEFHRIYLPENFLKINENVVSALGLQLLSNNRVALGLMNGCIVYDIKKKSFIDYIKSNGKFQNGHFINFIKSNNEKYYANCWSAFREISFSSNEIIDSIESASPMTIIYKLTNDKILAGTDWGGLQLIIPSEHKIFEIPLDRINLKPMEWVNKIVADNFNQLWIATSKGLLKISERKAAIDTVKITALKNEKANVKIAYSVMLPMRKGSDLLVVTENNDEHTGIYNLKKNSLRFLITPWQNKTSKAKFPRSAMIDHKGNYWCCTPDYLFILDTLKNIWNNVSINFRDSFPPGTRNFSDLFEDSYGNIWIATWWRGAFKYNPVTQKLIYYPFKNTGKNSLQINDDINFAFEDTKHRLWMYSRNGLCFYNPTTDAFTTCTRQGTRPNDATENLFVSFIKTKKGEYYFLNQIRGIVEFNPEKISLKTYSITPFTLYKIENNSIGEDGKGNLWISSSHDLISFNPVNKKYDILNKQDGIDLTEISNSFYLYNDTFIFDGTGCLYTLPVASINRLKFNSATPALISDFKINDAELATGGDLNSFKTIDLNYTDNNLSFEFAVPDFRKPALNKILYKLTPVDANWKTTMSRNRVTYNNLQPGSYKLNFFGVNSEGIESKPKILSIIIHPVWWQTLWFKIIVVLTTIGITIYIIRLVIIAREQKQRNEFEKQQALQQERARISSDLHDDIGSNLTSIALLSEVAKVSNDKTQVEKNLNLISSSSSELVDKMSEIIWAMNSKNDTLENLIAYIREHAAEYFEPLNIKLIIEIPDTIPDKVISSRSRRNIFLAVKESLHNILKHADAKEVKLQFIIADKKFLIQICDNGNGFDKMDTRRFGNGLDSMKKRMNDINARYEINSEIGKGTTTLIHIVL